MFHQLQDENTVYDPHPNIFIPALKRKVVNTTEMWFQQDGATPHTVKDVLE